MSTPPVGVPTCYRHSDRETYIRCQRCERPICPDCMRDASVGFQCPECVAEGQRSVRQAKTAYGGVISANPGTTSLVLIAINVVVWVAIVASGGSDSPLTSWLAVHLWGICQDGDVGFYATQQVCDAGANASWIPGLQEGAWWQLVTGSFVHVQPWHIGMNMLALWSLGPLVERLLGRVRYVVLYLLASAASALSVYWLGSEFSITVGASGAIFGLLGAALVAGWKSGADLSVFRTTIVLAVIISVIPGVSWQGHLGGFVGGALAAAILAFAPRGQHRALVQAAGLTLLGAVVLAGTLLRTLTL
ncbi:rhomboid family intramembrane serine protease [Pimelobacter simplex]|uniref:rhomboid family intramembrane serine protease n=1 Tax=Nocardioides simplex TaxID=2045 RepID=UPI00381E0634